MKKHTVVCPQCGNTLHVPVNLNSTKVRCKCSEIINIPEIIEETQPLTQPAVTMNLPCPHCREVLELEGVRPDELVDCPRCLKPFKVPGINGEDQQTEPEPQAAAGSRKGLVFGIILAVIAGVGGIVFVKSRKAVNPVVERPAVAQPAPPSTAGGSANRVKPESVPVQETQAKAVPAPPAVKPAARAQKKPAQSPVRNTKPPLQLVGQWSLVSNRGTETARLDIRKDGIVLWTTAKAEQEARFYTQLDETRGLISSKKGSKSGKGWIIVHKPGADGVAQCDDGNSDARAFTLNRVK